MSDADTLTDAVSRIERKAANKEEAENIDEKVNSANRSLGRLNRELNELAEATEELQFYRQILYEAFDHSNDLSSISTALKEAEKATSVDRDGVVDKLVDMETTRYQEQISDATDEVESATDDIKDELRSYWSKWDEDLKSARELQRIIGQQDDEFAQTVDWLDKLVNQDMKNPQKDASSVVFEWENATEQWEENQSLQDLSSFKQTHGLDEETIDVIRDLRQNSVPLSSVDIDVLRELKQVQDLADAVELEI